MIRKVKTENGVVVGLPAAECEITSYKGIPFAAPPIGEYRFHAPMPAKDWEGELEAYKFSAIPMQPAPGRDKIKEIYTREWAMDPEIERSEDCLYLNVWVPYNPENKKLPVFVWFFGGGWQVGSTAEMEFDGERIARRGIVVVTANYRVNLFGFLAHPEITAENPEAPANFGLLDQQFALKWVQRNIAAFGGDPEKVTIGGQSAGGGSVMKQVASAQNKGLFRGAIVQSGAFLQPYATVFPKRNLQEAEQLGVEFFDFCGVKSLAEARALSTRELMRKWDEFGGYTKSVMCWTPIIDGKFLTESEFERILNGKGQPVPILTGHTSSEFWAAPEANTKEELAAVAERIFGEKKDEFLALLGAPDADLSEMKRNAALKTIEFAVRCLGESKHLQSAGLPVYYYEFDASIPGWDNPGTFHSVDLWFFFETLARCWRPFVGKHYDLARQMCNYWANFIINGDPNGCDADGSKMPEWKPYTKESPNKMLFADCAVPQTCPASPMMRMQVDNYLSKNGD